MQFRLRLRIEKDFPKGGGGTNYSVSSEQKPKMTS